VDTALLSKALQAAIEKLSRSAEDLSKAVATQDRVTVQVAPRAYAAYIKHFCPVQCHSFIFICIQDLCRL
jgi:hypothetical protein